MHFTKVRPDRIVAACKGWIRDLYDWFHLPPTSELRGQKLLREWLSPDQLSQYDEHQYFEAIGCHTGHHYRISLGRQLNVCQLDDDGRPLAGWCFVPAGDLVVGDVMLAQKIALETNELSALAVARSFAPKR